MRLIQTLCGVRGSDWELWSITADHWEENAPPDTSAAFLFC